MQPNDKRAKLQKATLPRCRMFLKTYLPFLPGFPVSCIYTDSSHTDSSHTESSRPATTGTPWYSVGEKKEVVLTAETIRLANYGWHELHKFPRVFPKVVDDHFAWQRAVPWILDKLGKSVHGKTELPAAVWFTELGFSKSDCRCAVELEQSAPELKPLLDAVSWLTVLTPTSASAMLKWFTSERENIVRLLANWTGIQGIQLVLLLFRLVEEDGPVRLAPILETLSTKNARMIPTPHEYFRSVWNRVLAAIAQRTQSPKMGQPQKEFTMSPPDPPESEWAEAVYNFTLQIADLPPKRRRLSLELFAEYIPPHLLERWRLWWLALEPVLQDSKKLVARVQQGIVEDTQKRARKAKTLQRRFGELFHRAPPFLYHRYSSLESILNLFVQWDDLEWLPCQKSLRALTQTLAIEHRQKTPRLETLVVAHLNLRFVLQGSKTDPRIPNISILLDEIRQWGIPQHHIPEIIDTDWPQKYSGDRDVLKRIGQSLRYWFVDLGVCHDDHYGCDDVITLAKTLRAETKINMCSRVLARREHLKTYYADETVQVAAILAENEKEFAQILAVLQKSQTDSEYLGGTPQNLYTLSCRLLNTVWQNELRESLFLLY